MTIYERMNIFLFVGLFGPAPIALLPIVRDLFSPEWLSWMEAIPRGIQTAIAATNSGWMMSVVIISHWRYLRLRKDVIRKDGLMCKYCGYDLHACVGNECPECGHAFDAQEIRRYWHMIFWRSHAHPPWEDKPINNE